MEILVITDSISLDEVKGLERTPVFYMANLGIEVARIFSSKKKNDSTMMSSAYERAKGILVHLLSSTARGAREEGSVLSDIIDDIIDSNQKYSVTAQSMNDYFMPFMLKANGQLPVVNQ